MTKLMKLNFKRQNNVDYESYADFARHATKKQKKTLIKKVIKKANDMQRELAL